MGKQDKAMFYRHLDRTRVYFEYGSGGSTYQASTRPNIKKIYSVESDIEWQTKLRGLIRHPDIEYMYNDMDTRRNTWGYPGAKATKQQKVSYSDQITNLPKMAQDSIGLVLIDGRFRVACCLKCHAAVSDNCLIAFDDFLNRPGYHAVLSYFDVVEKTADNALAILKRRTTVTVPKELIEKYELEAG